LLPGLEFESIRLKKQGLYLGVFVVRRFQIIARRARLLAYRRRQTIEIEVIFDRLCHGL